MARQSTTDAQIAQLQELITSAAGLKSVTVDGTIVNVSDLQAELKALERRQASERGRRNPFLPITLEGGV